MRLTVLCVHREQEAQTACGVTYLFDQGISPATKRLRVEAIASQSWPRAGRGNDGTLGQHRRRQRKLLHIHVGKQLIGEYGS